MMKTRRHLSLKVLSLLFLSFGLLLIYSKSSFSQAINSQAPIETAKLIFIHHSCGENWLSDEDGGLGLELANNNYFVSDTNYGWGPNSIGDATDYYNWIDWFVGSESRIYLDALFNESGQNSPYSRPIEDPGGENRIVLFKSCFPNSDLSGHPDDPASDGEWNSIGHAKFVYNQILGYFGSRPDKLFVAITPPPLLNKSNAENAREFSRWLVEDWLKENSYPLENVAVWDFHNVLTHPDNIHIVQNDSLIYEYRNGDGTLYYDSDGDEHPNSTGNRKSTNQFVPMLNVFYNRWIINATESLDDPDPNPSIENAQNPDNNETNQQDKPLTPEIGQLIDDFEGEIPSGTNGWESYFDDATNSSLTCVIDKSKSLSGEASLRIDFNVQPNGWATCPLFFDNQPGFGNYDGIGFHYRSSEAGMVFNFDALTGQPGARSSYYYAIETVPESTDGWITVELFWNQIVGVDWEENPGKPIEPEKIMGVSYGFSTYEGAPNTGTIWIDNLNLLVGDDVAIQTENNKQLTSSDETNAEPTTPSNVDHERAGEIHDNPREEDSEDQSKRLCPGSTALIGFLFTGAVLIQRFWWKDINN